MQAPTAGLGAALLMGLFVGCEGVTPEPSEIAAREIPIREIDPAQRERVAVLVNRALAKLAAQEYAIAEDDARAALDLDPREARARGVLGVCLLHRAAQQSPPDFRLMNTGDGETLLALRLGPDDPVVGRLRARFLMGTDHLSAAAEISEQVLGRCPDAESEAATELLALAAELRYELGEERLARPHLSELARRRPDDATTRFRLAMCSLKIGETQADFEAAVAEFTACAELDRTDQDAHLAVGQAWARAAEAVAREGGEGAPERERSYLQAALAAFDDATERFPGTAAAWFGRGIVLERLERVDDAIAAYRSALQRDSEYLGAMLNLGALLAATSEENPERRPQAEEILRRALEVGGSQRLTGEERRRIDEWLSK